MNELHVKLGRLLQLERERQNLKLDDLSQELKISLENLEAIESGNTDSLPSVLYFGLFAKSYSERLGVDYSRTTDAIQSDIAQPEQNGTTEDSTDSTSNEKGSGDNESQNEQVRFGKKMLRNVVIAAVGFAALLSAYVFFFGTGNSGNETDAGLQESEDTNSDRSMDAQFASYNWKINEAAEPKDLVLKLTATDESWATILADDDTVIYRLLKPGRVYTATANYRLRISIGIPSRVRTELNGKVVNLVNPATRRISRVRIDQLNLSEFMSADTDKKPISASPKTKNRNNGGNQPPKQSSNSTDSKPEAESIKSPD